TRNERSDPGGMRRCHRGALQIAVGRPRHINNLAHAVGKQSSWPSRKHTTVRRCRRALQDRIATWRDNLDAAESVTGVERLELQVSIRGHANHARHLDRDDGAGIGDLPWHWRGIIRALQIHGRVGKVVSKVALRRDHDGAVLHSETDRTPFGFPDRALYRIVLAVEVPWI